MTQKQLVVGDDQVVAETRELHVDYCLHRGTQGCGQDKEQETEDRRHAFDGRGLGHITSDTWSVNSNQHEVDSST